jgi:hypothetical protein
LAFNASGIILLLGLDSTTNGVILQLSVGEAVALAGREVEMAALVIVAFLVWCVAADCRSRAWEAEWYYGGA